MGPGYFGPNFEFQTPIPEPGLTGVFGILAVIAAAAYRKRRTRTGSPEQAR
jgi:hypothetical protein